MLSQLFTTVTTTDCNGVSPDTVASLATMLRSNPRYLSNPSYNQFHYKLLAGIARQQGDYDTTIASLRKAIAYRPSSELNMMMVTALGGAGDFAAAIEFIDNAQEQSPGNPWRAIIWKRDLDELRTYVRKIE
jgi:tetratricopeptide (TPR) repeat protein